MGPRICDFEREYLRSVMLFRSNLESVLVRIYSKKNIVYEVWLYLDYIYVEKLDIKIFWGYRTRFDIEKDDYIPNDIVYRFYDNKTREWVHEEGGSDLKTAVANYCIKKGLKELANISWGLEYTFYMDNGKFLRKVL